MGLLELQSDSDGVEIRVHVQPRAPKDSVGGIHEGALRVRVRAAPTGGAANAAVCRCLARALGVRPRRIELRSGAKSRRKRVRIEGSPTALVPRLEELAGHGFEV